MKQFHKAVIPGEPNYFGGDPESRSIVEYQIILNPGSYPTPVFAEASPDRPRDLAGITHYNTAYQEGGGCLGKCQMPRVSTRGVLLSRDIRTLSSAS